MENSNSVNKSLAVRDDMQRVICAISSIRYGSVTVIVQDGKIVQIEKNEKERIR